MDERETRAVFARLLQDWKRDRRAAEAYALRGKTCPIQRPGLKR